MRNFREIEKYFERDIFDNFNKMSMFNDNDDIFSGMENNGNFYC